MKEKIKPKSKSQIKRIVRMQEGWKCPNCGKVMAPWIDHCLANCHIKAVSSDTYTPYFKP
jgi:hypothetical protein